MRLTVCKSRKDSDLSITVLGDTFNFRIVKGVSRIIFHNRLEKMQGWDKILMIVKMRHTAYERKKGKLGKFWNNKPKE